MNAVIPCADQVRARNARLVLSLILLLVVALFAMLLVGTRGIDIGTDTHVYAGFFMALREGTVITRFEPGFVLLTGMLAATGMSVVAYQCALFAFMLLTVVLSSRRYFAYLSDERGYLTYLTATLLFLLVSPVFVNATINAMRQGLASLLVFTALLSFYRHQWRSFFLYGALAVSIHYSSALYLIFAPALLLSVRRLRIVAALAFLAYCSGLTMIVVRAAVPSVYTLVMDYSPSATYRAGVRLDFAVFSIFWYLLPFMAARVVREPFSTRIKEGTAVYLALLLPFFAVGWGNYSNRYLLSAWLAISLILAAMAYFSRLPPLRNPLLLRGALLASCGVFYYYVTNMVIL